jgi:hypothetical protein
MNNSTQYKSSTLSDGLSKSTCTSSVKTGVALGADKYYEAWQMKV